MNNTKSKNRCLFFNEQTKKRSNAETSLQSYLNQLRFHYDLSEKDIVIILKHILRIKNNNVFLKKVWNILK